MSLRTLRDRLLRIERDFLNQTDVHTLDPSSGFLRDLLSLQAEVEAARVARTLDIETSQIAHNVGTKIATFTQSLLSLHENADEQIERLFQDALNLEEVSVADVVSASSPSPPRAPSPDAPLPPHTRFDPRTPPYIEAAYRWLLKHIHNPYPKKETKERLAEISGSTQERITEWFVDARRRMGWTKLLREEFDRRRADMIDAAHRFFIHPIRGQPLPQEIFAEFAKIEQTTREMYAGKFIPGDLSNKMAAVVRDMSVEKLEKTRLKKMERKALEDAAAAHCEGRTVDAGHKRSRSDADEYVMLSRKRFRTGDHIPLPSPAYSVQVPDAVSNPRKRRLSSVDSQHTTFKRPRTQAEIDDSSRVQEESGVEPVIPITVTLAGTPDVLADWFSTDRNGETDIFEPGQLLDIQFFDPLALNMSDEDDDGPVTPVDAPAQPMFFPSPTFGHEDTLAVDVPADLQALFDWSITVPQNPAELLSADMNSNSTFVGLDPQGTISYEVPQDLLAGFPAPLPGLEGSVQDSFITPQSVAQMMATYPDMSYGTYPGYVQPYGKDMTTPPVQLTAVDPNQLSLRIFQYQPTY
ncbi:unnamed protein product [Mycena citricolor]|uniref:Homeobox domain-containing protein n=1 Tax=Mycena citricolor TaxID=2018698 RepID=A0AAD2HR38_9AGAR|nr:unnamed protein product [Mycena citricolor]